MSKRYDWYVGQTFQGIEDNTFTVTSFEGYSYCYVVCSVCHLDKELFPDPIKVNKYKMKNKQQVCGCGSHYKWSEKQYRIRVRSECESRGYSFLGWKGEYKRSQTVIHTLCEKGHDYYPTIESFLGKRKRGCRICGIERSVAGSTLSQETWEDRIHRVLGGRDYHHNIINFGTDYRSKDKVTFYCEKLGCDYSMYLSNLMKYRGDDILPCCKEGTSGFDSNLGGYFYISCWLSEERDNMFYKYGISNHPPLKRLKAQSKKTLYNGKLLGCLFFEKGVDALLLEKSLYETYKNRGVSKQLFEDGYTETILYNDVLDYMDLSSDLLFLGGYHLPTQELFTSKDNLPFQGEYRIITKEEK
ncbi:hypothetical protein NVP1170O_186 [Vibrio phage 1.170.O._10N.261.52.C3]|nr:hypothetical protein NVP1170O_186 [Vibrio phage 1.170.O._10N.261.52.C3]